MRKSRLLVILGLAACLVAGLAVLAKAEVGVTPTEIRIGQWGPQTGLAAAWGSVARGTEVYVKMINAAGGIHGRKIKYYLFDDGYNPAKTKAGVIKLVQGPGVFAFVGGVGTGPGMAVRDYLQKRRIPWVGMATGSRLWAFPPNKYRFAMYPNYDTEAKALTRYAVTKLKKKRIAFFYQDDDYGKGGLVGFLAELKRLKMKPAAVVPVQRGVRNLASHALLMRKAKADCVILWVMPRHAIILLATSRKLGFKPTWMTSSTLSDYPFMLKISRGLWTGMIFGNFGLLPDSKNPLMRKYYAAYKKYARKGERWGVFFYAGIGFVEPAVEALKRVGKNLTVARFVAALSSLRNFQGIFGKVSFSKMKGGKCLSGKDCRQGQRSIFLAQGLKGGKVKRLSGWLSPK